MQLELLGDCLVEQVALDDHLAVVALLQVHVEDHRNRRARHAEQLGRHVDQAVLQRVDRVEVLVALEVQQVLRLAD